MGAKAHRKQQEQQVPETTMQEHANPAFSQAYGNAAQMERLKQTCTEPKGATGVLSGLGGFGRAISTGLDIATGANPAKGLLRLGKSVYDGASRQSECAPYVARPQNGMTYDQQHDAATDRALNGKPEPDSTLMQYLECLDADQKTDKECMDEHYGQ